MTIQNKRFSIILGFIALLLLIPFIAMQFTSEVNWSASDFILGGALLIGTGVACELVLRNVKTKKARLVLCAVILCALLLVWAELSVGIFGTAFAGN